MARTKTPPSGREISFAENDIIVSKTDLRGVMTYVNDVFVRVSGYSEAELLGQPHNLIRHPGMPRCVFSLLWQTVQAGQEIFAYVINQAKNGDAYWVFAHVTPSYDGEGRHVGYHSNRRVPYADALPAVRSLYADLLREEQKHANPKEAAAAGVARLTSLLKSQNVSYGEFVFSLSRSTKLEAA